MKGWFLATEHKNKINMKSILDFTKRQTHLDPIRIPKNTYSTSILIIPTHLTKVCLKLLWKAHTILAQFKSHTALKSYNKLLKIKNRKN